jgi:hypothetical protein
MMAIVTALRQVTKERPGRPKTTVCGFCTVQIEGTRYLLLESYGSPDREIPDNVSQSLHLDRDHAARLKTVLEGTFPGS